MEKRMTKIPRLDSITELARFWDTHDLTDFEDELEEVKEPVFELESQTAMRIHLNHDQAATLRRLARDKGMDERRLIEEWVNEKLGES